eukprot:SAG31_NODE_3517_length_4167_cov_1.945428_1_plen_317_part_00
MGTPPTRASSVAVGAAGTVLLPSLLVMLAAVGLPASDAAKYYASPRGSTRAEGSIASPTTVAACVGRIKSAGDECRLLSGTYREATVVVDGLRGKDGAPVVIAAADGADVTIDGTAVLRGTWIPAGNGQWEMDVPATIVAATGGVSQLWLDGQMLTPARWPNALWTNMQNNGLREPFNFTSWSTFAKGPSWPPSNYTSGVPLHFTDRGGPAGLGASGFSAKGAVFVGNIAHDDTFVGTVVSHTAGSDNFSVLIYPGVQKMGNTKQGNSIYFLEGPVALLDQPGEWSYSVDDEKLRIRTFDGASPEGHEVTHKVCMC